MERKTKVKIMLICIMILSFIILISYGKETYATVECKPSKAGTGKDALVNTTISNSYLLCRGMTGTGGTLYGSSVEPHLATNKDWGAVSYLSNSAYGTNTTGGNTGIQVSINGVNYYSTNGNKTGVMNWGSNPNKYVLSQTAGIISNCDSNVSQSVIIIYENIETRFVEIVGNTNGFANHPWYNGSYNYMSNEQRYPTALRKGIFGFYIGIKDHNSDTYGTTGEAKDRVTFRPVVWNQ